MCSVFSVQCCSNRTNKAAGIALHASLTEMLDIIYHNKAQMYVSNSEDASPPLKKKGKKNLMGVVPYC